MMHSLWYSEFSTGCFRDVKQCLSNNKIRMCLTPQKFPCFEDWLMNQFKFPRAIMSAMFVSIVKLASSLQR